MSLDIMKTTNLKLLFLVNLFQIMHINHDFTIYEFTVLYTNTKDFNIY